MGINVIIVTKKGDYKMRIKSEYLKEHLYNTTAKFPLFLIISAFLIYSFIMSGILGTIAYILISFSFILLGFESDLFHSILHIVMILIAFSYITKDMWPALRTTIKTNYYYKNKKV